MCLIPYTREGCAITAWCDHSTRNLLAKNIVTLSKAPLISHVYELGLMDAVAVSQLDCFAAGVLFARTEGIVPAPEPTHALAEIVRIVNECKATGESKVLLTALCGHGHFDLAA